MKMKSCPFCGGKFEGEEDSDHHGEFFTAGCANEGCPLHHLWYTNTEITLKQAKKIWNTRMENVK